MKKYFFAPIVAVALLLCVGVTFAHAEQIDNFQSKLQIQNDGTLKVTETILYNPQNVAHHGIYRYIPLNNAQGGAMQISDVSVVDERGIPYQFTQSGFGTTLLLIGDPNNTFTTPKTYIISYVIFGAYSYYNNFDEIYWNATGNKWTFPIMSASTEIDLPSGISATQQACYYGVSGSNNSCSSNLTVSPNGSILIFSAPRKLEISEGLTVAVGFPKGVIPLQSTSSKAQNIFLSYLWLLVFLVIPVPVFLALWGYWSRKGRAPKGTGVIVPQYDAPQGLTPIELAGLLDEIVPKKAISAEIIYLAVNGFLKISQVEEKFLAFLTKDYELQKLKEPEAGDSPDSIMMRSLFVTSSTVKLSDLKKTFYSDVPAINKATIGGLVSKGLFRYDPSTTKNLFRVGGIILSFGSLIITPAVTNSLSSAFFDWCFTLALFASLFGSGIMLIVTSFLISAKTESGVKAKEYILGFKEYLQIAEKDRIKFAMAPEKKPETFEKLLPYAIVLGVEKAWAKEFEGIYTTPPSWYSGHPGTVFSAVVFTNNLSAFNSAALASLASPRGGSGGGGFSGGGGGGGGGGSW